MSKKLRSARLKERLDVLLAHPAGELKLERLEGFAYRFTLYLPLLANGKEVFTGQQLFLLQDLFNRRFRGYSATMAEGNPPWYGSWLPQGAKRPIIDKHILLVVYCRQVEDADHFFGYLKSILQRDDVARQEVVVIEKVTVALVPALVPPEPPT